MTRLRKNAVLAVALAYVLVLQGLIAAGLTGAHAAAMADAAAGIICTPSEPGADRDAMPDGCDCGPACIQGVNTLAGPDPIAALDGLLRPRLDIAMAADDGHAQRFAIASQPHASRAPPLPSLI